MRCLPKSVISYFWDCRVNFPSRFPFCSKGFALLVSILCSLCLLVGLWSQNSHVKLICFVSVSSVLFVPPTHLLVKHGFILLGLPCQFSQVLSILFKRACLGCVHSVLFVPSCGPWCQKILILSWFALFPSLLCSLCLRCFPSFLNGLPLVLCLCEPCC